MLFKLAAPIVLGNFAYAFLGITDIMMSGLAGTSDQAGVAIGALSLSRPLLLLSAWSQLPILWSRVTVERARSI